MLFVVSFDASGCFGIGLCYGPVNPVSTLILAGVVPEKSRPFYFSIKQTGMPAGAAVAGVILPPIVANYDWRVAIILAGFLALIVAIFIQPLRRTIDSDRDPKRTLRIVNFVSPLRLVWQTPLLRSLGFMGFVYAGGQVSIASFFVVYLTAQIGMTLSYGRPKFYVIAGVCRHR